MSKTEIIFVRHGQSIGNLKKIFLGQTDMDLSEKGYKQAELVCDYLKNEDIDVIYSSDLTRTYNTILPLAKSKKMEIIKSKNLREIDAGLWEGKDYDIIDEKYHDEYNTWKNDIGNAKCNGGESVMDLQKRIINEVVRITNENIGKTICIATHATPIRVLNALWNNVDKNDIKDIPWVTNASVTTAFYENGKFTMVKYGEDFYLGDEVTRLAKNI